jgi:excisionase family DNA binding protein
MGHELRYEKRNRTNYAPGIPLFVTVKQAAYLAQISPTFIWQAIRRGKGPPVHRVGRVIRIHRDELTKWIEGGVEAVFSTGNGGRVAKEKI